MGLVEVVESLEYRFLRATDRVVGPVADQEAVADEERPLDFE